MVDVTAKKETHREATARGKVIMRPETARAIGEGTVKKGDVFAVAKIAGIMAAKKTGELIPLCHPLQLTDVDVNLSADPDRGEILIESTVRSIGRTGVEMEALTAAAAAALAVYDMCKSADRDMIISDIKLIRKSGGKSGTYRRKED
jgi:cyclic pyranopterin phosphate synthase